jgi:ABC-2 type transport system ATP-binding protein
MSENKFFAIQADQIHMKYGKKKVLKDISLQVHPGEVFGLLGPNGAGKSTLLSIIANVRRPSSGNVYLNGEHQSSPSVKNQIGYVPQEISLYPTLSAEENLLFWANIYRVENKKRKMEEILDFLSLTDVAKLPVYQYSSGMKRRLNIGISLIHNPDILILDEPTVGIDLSSKLIILNKILALKKTGKTFIYTTHHPDEPHKICDRIGVLKNGELQYTGKIENVLYFFNKKSIEEIMS